MKKAGIFGYLPFILIKKAEEPGLVTGFDGIDFPFAVFLYQDVAFLG